MANKPWTKQEVDLLLNGKNVPTRSEKSIRKKLINLGLEKPKFTMRSHSKRPWTQHEIDLLKQNKKVPNRTKHSLRRMKINLGLVEKLSFRKPWGKNNEEILKKLVEQGKSARDIFNMKIFPYSRNSIQKKMGFMNLSKKTHKIVFSKDQILLLEKFLINNWIGKTPLELMNIWNSSSKTKLNKSKILYHLNKLKIKISYKEVANINKIRKIEKQVKENMKFANSKNMEEKLRNFKVQIMIKRLEQNKDIWSGLKFQENFDIKENENEMEMSIK